MAKMNIWFCDACAGGPCYYMFGGLQINGEHSCPQGSEAKKNKCKIKWKLLTKKVKF